MRTRSAPRRAESKGILRSFYLEDYQFVPYSNWINAHKAAVLGAGTMGGGIAAHLSNLGFEVLLFDLDEGAAKKGLERAKSARPPHFYDSAAAARVVECSFEKHLDRISQADWVCEAVSENAQVKTALYEKIEPHLREDAMISTNTSGLSIKQLCASRSESFKRRFIGTHFFNPPRYLKLIELIPTEFTDSEAVRAMIVFLEERAGRRVVVAKDTPGFIANRFGMWALYQAIHTVEKLGFKIETADAIAGRFLGRPSTAIFRLADLIGLDVMEDVANNLLARCQQDEFIGVLEAPESLKTLMKNGFVGTKSGHGFYQREGQQFLPFEFTTNAYRQPEPVEIPLLKELAAKPMAERLREALNSSGEVGEFCRMHLAPTLEYAAKIGSEISYSAEEFDRVMRWGWGWERGPFELIDLIGYDALRPHWKDSGAERKYYDTGMHFSFVSNRLESDVLDPRFAPLEHFPIISAGEEWAVRDDGMGGHIFQTLTKMNVLTPPVVSALIGWLSEHPGLNITLANSGKGFSAGYDLGFFLRAAEEKRFEDVSAALADLQRCSEMLFESKSCAAIHGFALGGGFELAMHCSAMVVDPESTVGLPEALVGLVPAGGGATMLRSRVAHDLQTFVEVAVEVGTGARVPAAQGVAGHFLRATDRLLVNPDMLVSTALRADRPAQTLAEWVPTHPAAAGMIDAKIHEWRAKNPSAAYGQELAEEVKRLFTKPKSREESLEMEREVFLRLLGKQMTQDRIKHMLTTNKPLVN